MIRKHIDDLAEKIDLVLIMEYFDESLVLLKRELCWDLDDVVYFKLNQRSQEYKQTEINSQQQVRPVNDSRLLLLLLLFFWGGTRYALCQVLHLRRYFECREDAEDEVVRAPGLCFAGVVSTNTHCNFGGTLFPKSVEF